jgi:hypothetical protein
VTAAIRLVREACRSRLNVAWYELAMAARTSESLQKGLEPAMRRYYEHIAAAARELLPEFSAQMGDSFEVLLRTVIAVFDGEAVERFALKQPAIEEARFELLVASVEQITKHIRR